MGAVKDTNSTFKSQGEGLASKPVGRWRHLLNDSQVAALESCIGSLLTELGYELTAPINASMSSPSLIKATYPLFFSTKHWLKHHTKVGRLTSVDRLKAA